MARRVTPSTRSAPSPGAAFTWRPWLSLVSYVRPYRGHLALGLALLLVNIGMDVLKPWPLKWIFDGVLLDRPVQIPIAGPWLATRTDMAVLVFACAMIFTTAIVAGLCEYGAHVLFATAGHRAVTAVRRDLFAHMQRLSLDFHKTSKSGELLTRLVKDVTEVRNALTDTALETVGEFLLLVGMLVLLWTIDPGLAVYSGLIFPPLVYCVWHYATGIQQATRRQRDKESKTASIFSESLAAISVVQMFSREQQTTARFDRESQKSVQADLVATRLKGRMNRWVEVIVAAGTCLVLFHGTRGVLNGSLTPGDLIVFSTYLRAMYKPVRRIAANILQASRATVGAARVVDILDTQPLIVDRPGARPAPRFAGRVTFDGVAFGYGQGPDVLHDLTFDVPAGAVAAIIGQSGAGKSTLASMIPRLYDPRRGRICIDGHDIRDYTVDSLREQVSIVAQEAVLFGMSIRDNIAYGSADASDERIERAARDAGAHEFIARMPRGYDTVVGERGATLSGGERQRLAVARAFCREAPLLILDEPTTGLDADAEAHLLASMRRLMVGKTCFVIAHKLSTIASADLILRVADGTISHIGTHRDLVAHDAGYRHLLALEASTGATA